MRTCRINNHPPDNLRDLLVRRNGRVQATEQIKRERPWLPRVEQRDPATEYLRFRADRSDSRPVRVKQNEPDAVLETALADFDEGRRFACAGRPLYPVVSCVLAEVDHVPAQVTAEADSVIREIGGRADLRSALDRDGRNVP